MKGNYKYKQNNIAKIQQKLNCHLQLFNRIPQEQISDHVIASCLLNKFYRSCHSVCARYVSNLHKFNISPIN